MAYIYKDKGFVHIPKTGGRTITDHLPWKRISKRHAEARDGREYFVCVRRPDTWIVSFHNHQKNATTWQNTEEFQSIFTDNFDVFIGRVIAAKGIIGRMFNSYLSSGKYFVGHTETLSDDFSSYMGKRINLQNKYDNKSILPEKYLPLLIKAESSFYDQFYPNFQIRR